MEDVQMTSRPAKRPKNKKALQTSGVAGTYSYHPEDEEIAKVRTPSPSIAFVFLARF